MKRCVTHCGLCKVSTLPYKDKTFNVSKPRVRYEWCVFRHSEPLGRGEYEISVKDSGVITGTVCYRSRVVPRTQMRKKRGQSGGVL